MGEPRFSIRHAVPSDATAMARVETASWPASLASPARTMLARILAWPEGQLVVHADGRIVGVSTAQRITDSFLRAHNSSYETLTDHDRFTASHHAAGEIYQLVGVGVLPEFRGYRLGRLLVDEQITRARQLPGVQRIIGFTRPVGYADHADLSIEEYVRRTDETGQPCDPVLAFHLTAGAKLVSVHPEFRPRDAASGRAGVLIEYPLTALA